MNKILYSLAILYYTIYCILYNTIFKGNILLAIKKKRGKKCIWAPKKEYLAK